MPKKSTLKELREAAGETQRQAAAAVGVHYVTWNLYENGKQTPSATIAQRIALHFNTSTDAIAFGSLAA